MLGAVVIGAAASREPIVALLDDVDRRDVALVLVIVVAAAIAALFAVGIARRAVRLARLLAAVMIPAHDATRSAPTCARRPGQRRGARSF